MNKFFKRLIKKAFKTGYFHSFVFNPGYLSFKDVHGAMYVVQKDPDKFGYWFRIGIAHQWKDYGLTFQSDYKSLGTIDRASFTDFIKPTHTDNPDFILRTSLNSLLGTI